MGPAALYVSAPPEEMSRLRIRFARHDRWRTREAMPIESRSLRPKPRPGEARNGEASTEYSTPIGFAIRRGEVSTPRPFRSTRPESGWERQFPSALASARAPGSPPASGNRHSSQRGEALPRPTPTDHMKLVSKQSRKEQVYLQSCPPSGIIRVESSKILASAPSKEFPTL